MANKKLHHRADFAVCMTEDGGEQDAAIEERIRKFPAGGKVHTASHSKTLQETNEHQFLIRERERVWL